MKVEAGQVPQTVMMVATVEENDDGGKGHVGGEGIQVQNRGGGVTGLQSGDTMTGKDDQSRRITRRRHGVGHNVKVAWQGVRTAAQRHSDALLLCWMKMLAGRSGGASQGRASSQGLGGDASQGGGCVTGAGRRQRVSWVLWLSVCVKKKTMRSFTWE